MKGFLRSLILSFTFLLQISCCFAQSDQTIENGGQSLPVNFPPGICTFRWTNDNPAIGLPAAGTGNIPAFTAINNTRQPLVANIKATSSGSGFAYIADVYLNIVSVIDIATDAIVARIPVGSAPTGVYVNPAGDRVYVTNYDAHTVSVIDASRNTVIATIPLDNALGGIVVSPDGSRVYVADLSGTLVTINAATNTVVAKLTVPASAYFMCMNRSGTRLYLTSSYNNELSVINTTNNIIASKFSIGYGSDASVLSSDETKLYVSTRNNAVMVLDALTGQSISSFSMSYPGAMALNADGSRLYVCSQGTRVVVINLQTSETMASIPVNQYAEGLSLTQDGSRLYVIGQVGSTVSVISTANNTVINRIRVGSNPYSKGNFISGCTANTVNFKITVKPEVRIPAISVNASLTGSETVYGSPSTPQTFMLSAVNLEGALETEAPDGFELSTDGIAFKQKISIPNTSDFTNLLVYLRFAATTQAGEYQGDILISSLNAVSKNVNVPEGRVFPAILYATVNSVTRYFGMDNPVFTLKYNGFMNGDSQKDLVSEPVISTLATRDSPIGEYPLTAVGGAARNYGFIYVDGSLKIIAMPLATEIPSSFTPNGDGINDVWQIKYLAVRTDCKVEVYNRNGVRVFGSSGYARPWDGTYKGTDLPVGTYFYKVSFADGTKGLSGPITIIR